MTNNINTVLHIWKIQPSLTQCLFLKYYSFVLTFLWSLITDFVIHSLESCSGHLLQLLKLNKSTFNIVRFVELNLFLPSVKIPEKYKIHLKICQEATASNLKYTNIILRSVVDSWVSRSVCGTRGQYTSLFLFCFLLTFYSHHVVGVLRFRLGAWSYLVVFF